MTSRSQKIVAGGATELYPIRTVASLTGVNPITLRAWERRYGLIRPVRTPSGHRMYTREHIDRVNRALAMIEKGGSIAQVSQRLSRKAGSAKSDTWSALQERMIAAVVRFDEIALEETYNEALAAFPLELVTQSLLMPLLDMLGRRWESAEGSVAEEHFFATYVRNKLGARFHHRSQLTAGPKLLAACAPGEHHEIGLLLFALSAHDAGLRTVLLGANIPLSELSLACRQAGCDAIVISCSMELPSEVLSGDLPTLVSAAGGPVFVGGVGAASHRDAIAAAGAVALGADIPTGVRRVLGALTETRTQR